MLFKNSKDTDNVLTVHCHRTCFLKLKACMGSSLYQALLPLLPRIQKHSCTQDGVKLHSQFLSDSLKNSHHNMYLIVVIICCTSRGTRALSICDILPSLSLCWSISQKQDVFWEVLEKERLRNRTWFEKLQNVPLMLNLQCWFLELLINQLIYGIYQLIEYIWNMLFSCIS